MRPKTLQNLSHLTAMCFQGSVCNLSLHHLSKDAGHLRTVVKWIGIIRSCSVSVDVLFRRKRRIEKMCLSREDSNDMMTPPKLHR